MTTADAFIVYRAQITLCYRYFEYNEACILEKCIVLPCGCHGCVAHEMRVLELTHSDAKLHVFSAVNFHAFIQQANFLKVSPVDHKAANQSRAPKVESIQRMSGGQRKERGKKIVLRKKIYCN